MTMSTPRQTPEAESPDFSVTIVACGPLPSGKGMVYAVAVSQPVQSWSVLRSHDDFVALNKVLAASFPSLNFLMCPLLKDVPTTQETILMVRNELQKWLSSMLLIEVVRESTAVSEFLTVGANSILEGIHWTHFTTAMMMKAPCMTSSNPAYPSTPPPPPPLLPIISASIETTTPAHCNTLPSAANSRFKVTGQAVYDMEMYDMFLADEEGNGLPEEDNQDEFDDDDIPSASVRYKPLDEAVTDEDELSILAGDVEMVEDIGSLAQSLGASHLGRSLQLQAELENKAANTTFTQGHTAENKPMIQGLNIGGASARHRSAFGGIGGIISMAAQQSGPVDLFNRRPLDSAPRLDSFKMIRVIGKGSFGKVFLVREIKTNQIYALKVLRKDNIIKRNQVEHTKTERSVLGYVRHPFIVGMNMAFQSKDKLYFVLDYCAGGELFFQLGKEGRFSEPRSRFYAAEIVLAISYVHKMGIIYRDLKPENVLLDAEGHIRLTDFGLSKEGISGSSSGANSFCGTPEYLAPEILDRLGHGRAVDWWSLGALLYEMLTGLPPFYCQDRERLFEKIRKSELVYPASLSRPSVGVLKGLLTKDPTRRLGSGPEDAAEIQCHEFFVSIEWEKLFQGEIQPPWRPNINGALDTSQFDKEFTNMPVFSPQSMQKVHGFGATPNDSHFEGFTFTDRGLLHGQH